MVETNLTKEMIDAGAVLIGKMDRSKMQPDAVFWMYFPEIQRWKLVIVEIKLGMGGPKQGYRQIQTLLRKYTEELKGLTLDDVTLEKPNARIVSLLRTAIRTGPGISGIRFKNSAVNGNLIEDVYIYRI